MSSKRKQAAKAGGPANRTFIVILAVILVIGVGAIGYVVSQGGARVTMVDPNLPPPSPAGVVMGSPTAPVEIIEFADFECPGCGHFAVMYKPDVQRQLVETGQARFRFVDFPLPQHRNSPAAHNAAACANDQGRFWEMHDRIFVGRHEWATEATSNPGRVLKGYARDLGLDMREFDTCFDSRRHQAQIEANLQEGVRIGVGQTPTFIVGRRMIPGAQPVGVLRTLVDSAAAEAAAAPGAPQVFRDTGRAVRMGG